MDNLLPDHTSKEGEAIGEYCSVIAVEQADLPESNNLKDPSMSLKRIGMSYLQGLKLGNLESFKNPLVRSR